MKTMKTVIALILIISVLLGGAGCSISGEDLESSYEYEQADGELVPAKRTVVCNEREFLTELALQHETFNQNITPEMVTLGEAFQQMSVKAVEWDSDQSILLTIAGDISQYDEGGRVYGWGEINVSAEGINDAQTGESCHVDVLYPEITYDVSGLSYSKGEITFPVNLRDTVFAAELNTSDFMLEGENAAQHEVLSVERLGSTEATIKLFGTEDAFDGGATDLDGCVLTIRQAATSAGEDLHEVLNIGNAGVTIVFSDAREEENKIVLTYTYSVVNGTDVGFTPDDLLFADGLESASDVQINEDTISFAVEKPALPDAVEGVIVFNGEKLMNLWGTPSWDSEEYVYYEPHAVSSGITAAETTLPMLSTANSSVLKLAMPLDTVTGEAQPVAEAAGGGTLFDTLYPDVLKKAGSYAVSKGCRWLLNEMGFEDTSVEGQLQNIKAEIEKVSAQVGQVQITVDNILKQVQQNEQKTRLASFNNYLLELEPKNSSLIGQLDRVYDAANKQDAVTQTICVNLDDIYNGLRTAVSSENGKSAEILAAEQKLMTMLTDMGVDGTGTEELFDVSKTDYFDSFIDQSTAITEMVKALNNAYTSAGITNGFTQVVRDPAVMRQYESQIAGEIRDISEAISGYRDKDHIIASILGQTVVTDEDGETVVEPNEDGYYNLMIRYLDALSDAVQKYENASSGEEKRSVAIAVYDACKALQTIERVVEKDAQTMLNYYRESPDGDGSKAEEWERFWGDDLTSHVDALTHYYYELIEMEATNLAELEGVLQEGTTLKGQYEEKAKAFVEAVERMSKEGSIGYTSAPNILAGYICPSSVHSPYSTSVIADYDALVGTLYNFDTQTEELRKQYRAYVGGVYLQTYMISANYMALNDQISGQSNNASNLRNYAGQLKNIDTMMGQTTVVSATDVYCYVTEKRYTREMVKTKASGFEDKPNQTYAESWGRHYVYTDQTDSTLWERISAADMNEIANRMHTDTLRAELKDAGFALDEGTAYLCPNLDCSSTYKETLKTTTITITGAGLYELGGKKVRSGTGVSASYSLPTANPVLYQQIERVKIFAKRNAFDYPVNIEYYRFGAVK